MLLMTGSFIWDTVSLSGLHQKLTQSCTDVAARAVIAKACPSVERWRLSDAKLSPMTPKHSLALTGLCLALLQGCAMTKQPLAGVERGIMPVSAYFGERAHPFRSIAPTRA
jgi:hypothetical protein